MSSKNGKDNKNKEEKKPKAALDKVIQAAGIITIPAVYF